MFCFCSDPPEEAEKRCLEKVKVASSSLPALVSPEDPSSLCCKLVRGRFRADNDNSDLLEERNIITRNGRVAVGHE
jgi:hypothetical protein